jgi:hypothetical protein
MSFEGTEILVGLLIGVIVFFIIVIFLFIGNVGLFGRYQPTIPTG